MHIPDGYLSPSTCATLCAGSAPFWYVSLQRMKRAVNSRMVPLLAVFAAFSFIVMMFNLPLPGGTTGHAVGVSIATIVLGPWGSILAISIALTIQAIFFGDGGITSLGANCFNMAIVGSLATYTIYRVISRRAPIESRRRVIAAAIAGYLSINIAALVTAIELGIQPLLFRDASGAPLYAPYNLHIAIPAMMIGHLTVAGLAEAIVTAGAFAYLQRAEPLLLMATAHVRVVPGSAGGWRVTKPLWIALATMMVLTPIGIMAAGSAWSQWSAEDFSNPEMRTQITSSSGNQAPPDRAPMGLQRLGSFWTAPMPRYAPPFLKSARLGYLLSAMAGVGLIILVSLLAGSLSNRLSNEHTGAPSG